MTWFEWVYEMIYAGRWGGVATAAVVLGVRGVANRRRILALEAECAEDDLLIEANNARIAYLEADLVELRRAEAIMSRVYAGRGSTRHLHVVGSPDVAPPLSVQLAEMLDERPPVGGGDALQRP